MGDIYTNPPQSRNEAILRATIDGTEYTDPPQSRIEDLLLELKEAIEEGGGSVESYEQLTNKPQINGTTLSGNKTTWDLIPIGDGLQINADGELETADAYIPTSEKGTASGVATLTEAGKVPEAQLPSYVDDAIEGYLYEGHFYADSAHTEEITGERGKIYVDLDTNRAYRWTGSMFVEIGDNNTFTANRALVSDANGKVSASSATSEEVGYLSGVTGAIQTQINGKQNTLTFDETPTAQSTNPVTSGGIKTYVDAQGAKTVSGNPITITDAEGMNADHVVATITPTQTGSGTPSPSNVRLFVGFSNVYIDRCGKNLFNKNSQQIINGKRMSTSTGGTYSDGNFSVSHYIKVNPSEFYTLSTGYTSYFCVYDENLVFKQGGSWSDGQSIQMPSNVKYIRFDFPTANIDVVQFEKGQQATAYEPYQGQTYTVQLGDTYYQGVLDLTSGVFRSEYKIKDLSTFTWYKTSDNTNRWYNKNSPFNDIVSVSSTAVPMDAVCDSFEVYSADNIWGDHSLIGISLDTNNYIFIRNDLETAPTGNLVYRTKNPIEIQLTPQQIALLENNNTITTNVSSLDITYQTNTAIGDTASALDKRVTSLESKVPQPPTTDGTYKLTVTVASGTPTYSWESAT